MHVLLSVDCLLLCVLLVSFVSPMLQCVGWCRAAHEYAESGHPSGKVVLTVAA